MILQTETAYYHSSGMARRFAAGEEAPGDGWSTEQFPGVSARWVRQPEAAVPDRTPEPAEREARIWFALASAETGDGFQVIDTTGFSFAGVAFGDSPPADPSAWSWRPLPTAGDTGAEKSAEATPEAPEQPQSAEELREDLADVALHGSGTLDAIVNIGEHRVQLGGLVLASFRESGLTTADWNALEPAERDELLVATHVRLGASPDAFAAEIDPASVLPAPIVDEDPADPPADKVNPLLDADGDNRMGGSIDKYDQMSDEALRVFIQEKTEQLPNGRAKRPRLLELARKYGA